MGWSRKPVWRQRHRGFESHPLRMKKGPYKGSSSKIAYKNPWITVREDTVVRKDGKEGIFGVVDYGRGVSIVALDNKNNISLIKEYYYAIEKSCYEIPSGGVETGESELEAAKRELLEEAGLASEKWVKLGYVAPLTMIVSAPAYLFLAQNTVEKREPSDKEIVEVIKVPFQKAYKMVLDNEITHAPSCVAILKTKNYLEKS